MQRATRIARAEGAGSTFEQFLEFVPDAIVGVGREGEIVLVNRHAEELFGYARDELGQIEQVLVVEDEPDMLRMAGRILSRAGYSVIGTASGVEAVKHEVLAPRALAEDDGRAFIEKPFNAKGLLETVRTLLDSDGAGGAADA